MTEHESSATSPLGNVLSQKTLIRDADTRTLIDRARENNKSFDVVFNVAVKNMSAYSTVESHSNGNGNNK
jgi:hypothetical protein